MNILKRLLGIPCGPKIKNTSKWNLQRVERKVKFISRHLPMKDIIDIWNESGEDGIDKLLCKYKPRSVPPPPPPKIR